jgi:hypothetical protein
VSKQQQLLLDVKNVVPHQCIYSPSVLDDPLRRLADSHVLMLYQPLFAMLSSQLSDYTGDHTYKNILKIYMDHAPASSDTMTMLSSQRGYHIYNY